MTEARVMCRLRVRRFHDLVHFQHFTSLTTSCVGVNSCGIGAGDSTLSFGAVSISGTDADKAWSDATLPSLSLDCKKTPCSRVGVVQA